MLGTHRLGLGTIWDRHSTHVGPHAAGGYTQSYLRLLARYLPGYIESNMKHSVAVNLRLLAPYLPGYIESNMKHSVAVNLRLLAPYLPGYIT